MLTRRGGNKFINTYKSNKIKDWHELNDAFTVHCQIRSPIYAVKTISYNTLLHGAICNKKYDENV